MPQGSPRKVQKEIKKVSTFFKFPTTPQLFVFPGLDIRDDKILNLSEKRLFLDSVLTAEEKIDGANIGISFDDNWNLKIQNRGAYINPKDYPQFQLLSDWAFRRIVNLRTVIGTQFILFGEWCYAKHTVFYTSLPDWFLGFDIFDRAGNVFISTLRRNQMFSDLQIYHVPLIQKKKFTERELIHITEFEKSEFSDDPIEGIYLRLETDTILKGRAKIVRPGFMQGMTSHWKDQKLIQNRLRS